MTEERDDAVSRRYRALGEDEPPPGLDRAILAASREAVREPAVKARPRWQVPFAAAAVLVLAVGVALQVERQAPEPEAVQSAPPVQPAQVAAPVNRLEEKPAQPSVREARKAPPSAEQLPPRAMEGPTEAQAKQSLASPPPAMAARAPAARDMASAEAVSSPEAELEKIAELRRQGEHERADSALEQFRKRYPGYEISAVMRERVERRVP